MHNIGRHNHSDLDTDDDSDPFYEYNMCHKQTRLESKEQTKQQHKEIEIKRFFQKEKMEPEVEVNIVDEILRIVDTKYQQAMDDIVNSDKIIDQDELKVFDCYTQRSRHLLEHSGIPNYEHCWQPLPQDYFEKTLPSGEKPSSIKRITPLTRTS